MSTSTAGDAAAAAYRRLTATLEDQGRHWSDVGRVNEYISARHLSSYPEVIDARHQVLGGASPAVVTTVVEALRPGDPPVQVTVADNDAARALDGVVYLPSVLPIDERGEVVAAGDFRGQYRWCLERAGVLLADLGLGLEHLVQTIDYSTPATRETYPRCGRPRRDLLGPVYPGAAGILTEELVLPDVLVAFDLVASRELPKAVNPGWGRYETLTYNPAVVAGNGLFGSGFAALDPVSQLAVHVDDLAAQTAYTYRSILAVLEAAGVGADALVDVREYLCPPAHGQADVVSGARHQVIGATPATVTTVGCSTLLRPQFLLEVVPTAVVPTAVLPADGGPAGPPS